MVKGRRWDLGLGPTDLVSLQEAREKALEGRKIARAGGDPSDEWKRPALVIPTFAEAATGYHDKVKAGWKNDKHEDEWLGSLERHAFPLIGKRLVDDIDAPAIQSVLVPMWLTLPETARRTRQRVLAVLDYAHGQGWRKSEAPRHAVNSLMKRIKQPKKGAGLAALPYAQIPALMAALAAAAPHLGLPSKRRKAVRMKDCTKETTGSQSTEPASLRNAPRCQARTRKGVSCRSAAVKGMRVCRMHGGKRSGAPKGKANGQWKHGGYTNEAVALRRAAGRLLRALRQGDDDGGVALQAG